MLPVGRQGDHATRWERRRGSAWHSVGCKGRARGRNGSGSRCERRQISV